MCLLTRDKVNQYESLINCQHLQYFLVDLQKLTLALVKVSVGEKKSVLIWRFLTLNIQTQVAMIYI